MAKLKHENELAVNINEISKNYLLIQSFQKVNKLKKIVIDTTLLSHFLINA